MAQLTPTKVAQHTPEKVAQLDRIYWHNMLRLEWHNMLRFIHLSAVEGNSCIRGKKINASRFLFFSCS